MRLRILIVRVRLVVRGMGSVVSVRRIIGSVGTVRIAESKNYTPRHSLWLTMLLYAHRSFDISRFDFCERAPLLLAFVATSHRLSAMRSST